MENHVIITQNEAHSDSEDSNRSSSDSVIRHNRTEYTDDRYARNMFVNPRPITMVSPVSEEETNMLTENEVN